MLVLLSGCDPSPPVVTLETIAEVAAPPPVVAVSPPPVVEVSPPPVVEVSPPAPELPPPPPPRARKPLPDATLPRADALPEPTYESYPALVAAIEAARAAFATDGTHEQARRFLRDAITDRIIPAWAGTRWAFYGADLAPSDSGTIACGYWVASVLRDAGLRIDRDHVGKQASERILLTVAPPARLRHFGDRYADAIAYAEKVGVGLWGVGLASHAGLLWNDGTEVRFCHSDYHGTQGPRCEPASSSWAFQTKYTVLGPILDDATLDAWFEGRTLPTGKFGG